MNTSSRGRPISPSSRSSSWPAWPTNGRPCSSSLAPGASPTNIRSASALPAPKTTVWRVSASCGQRVQPGACAKTAFEGLAAVLGGGHGADANPGTPANRFTGVASRRLRGTLCARSTRRHPSRNWTDILTAPPSPSSGAAAWAPPLAARAGRRPRPLGRGSDGAGADVVLLCVPDAEIAAAAAAVAPGAPGRPLLRRDDAGAARPARGVLRCTR